MTIPLILPFIAAEVEPFEPGDIVENFGQIARVVADDPERGLLLRTVGGSDRWFADPAKCRPVR